MHIILMNTNHNIAYKHNEVMVQKKLVTVHSVMNKITGELLFIMPLTVGFIDLRYSVAIVSAVAAFAAAQEGIYIRMGDYGIQES